MNSFEDWFEVNKYALKHIYYKLIDLCKGCNIIIINNQHTINNYLKMMYNESNKDIINYELYPEYFFD